MNNIIRCLLAFSLLLANGCSRPFYRKQADADAYCLTDQKAAVIGADPYELRIDVDPRSRMYDPNNPDVEPMPPDDPASHRYMECVDCKKGSKCWKCLPKTAYVDNPNWQEYLPRDGSGRVLLDLRNAVEVALRDSPEYQSQLEDLYLSALDVSFERFRFDTQFFGGSSIFLTSQGRDATGTGNSATTFVVSPLRPDNQLEARRLTATGGELVTGVANSLVWQFAGPNDYTSTTLMDFSLVQPLLRFGGRTRVLERLTISERTLLANVRQMERYRGGFYLNIATGRDAGGGPSRRGGFFGGSGLDGFAGVGGGGFGAVGNFGFGGGFGGFNFNQGVGGGFTGGAGAAGAGGFIGLLQTQQTIRNQRSNVGSLRDSYEQLQASYDAGRIDLFQVDLARQALYNAQSQLLTAEAGYQTTLDNYKITLGLPPELEVRIQDPMLERFNLLDPQLELVEERVTDALVALRELRQRTQEEANPLEIQSPEFARQFERWLDECTALEPLANERVDAVEADLRAVEAALPMRRQYLKDLAGREEVQQAQIDPRLFSVEELDRRVAKRREEYEMLKKNLADVWDRLDKLEQTGEADAAKLLPAVIDSMSDLSGRLLELSLVQAAARLDAIAFAPVELTDEEALLIASAYRRDWQNARAALVDSWRLIYFNANALLSDLNFLFSGDIGNVGDNPFRIRDTTGRLRVGLQWDPPMTRLAERNIYRQSLIEYQQARRSYYQYRDRVSQSLRLNLRQTRLNEINFELRRAAVLVAISQVDLTQLRLSQPPQVGVEAQFGDTTARDLVQSLSDLLNVQNDFLSVWVNYEVQRQALDFDLGILELDAAGVRREHEAPLTAYIAGAEAIRAQLCSASDIIPTLAKPVDTKPKAEPIEPLPLVFPDSLLPGEDGPPDSPLPPGELPAPLRNPAAAYKEPDPAAGERMSHDRISASDGRIAMALAEMPGFDTSADARKAQAERGGVSSAGAAGKQVRDDAVQPASYNKR
ncbi:TolC family protein [Lacipirellula limnantheis]|uniref:Outer membrane efflux protein n=1 Tax=Lacipirellula limnantheis TaxID=2528024 RepID=A0A517U3F7_9BACT|nr:TolC family protein [Lacipirellula limnantheis]QDT75159.1 Outer membrane efflux protein [Lacipirellula limnantheis]